MINLQSSKKIIRSYEEMLPASFSTFNHTQANLLGDHSARMGEQGDRKEDSNFPFGRTISKMIKIEFQENPPLKLTNDIRIKRKMLTSSEKFHTRKKNNYATSLKEAYSKAAASEKVNRSYLTIGSHAIQKMNYDHGLYTKEFKFSEDCYNTKKKRFHSGAVKAEVRSPLPPKPDTNVLILKKNSNNRLEELLFKNTNAAKQQSTARLERQIEKAFLSKPCRDGKVYSIEEYIPIRRTTIKREPFVFGMSEKQLNPQRNREKLLIYHDFLWKVNYSNGLYVRASDQDTTYRACIGFGNNSNLIKSILRRRYWWNVIDRPEGCNFSWTQLKVNSVFRDAQGCSSTSAAQVYCRAVEVPGSSKTEPIARLQEGHERIFNKNDLLNWNRHMKKFRRVEATVSEKTYKYRAEFLSCKEIVRVEHSQKLVVHNHLQQNYYIGNKKSLFYHMKKFYQLQQLDVFTALPLTFHIAKGLEDPSFRAFQQHYEQLEEERRQGGDLKNIWIMKPGENSNRGNGISVCYSLDEVRLRIKAREKNHDGSLRTFIVQKYMEKPLLYKGRKFDIRQFLLLTSFNGIFKAYWFPEGYVRTSSTPFSLKRNTNLVVHLTNDAVQKYAEEYGKFEKGNKVSYDKFQNYLNRTLPKASRNCFFDEVIPQMKHLTLQALKATYLSLDPHKKEHNFELLGMDFMIDEELKPWLIEINTNPCLQLSSPLLQRIVPAMIEQTFRICVDPFFPPPDEWASGKKMHTGDNLVEENQFQLIFDESVDGEAVLALFGGNTALDANMGQIEEDTETFESEGVEEWEEKPK